MHRALVIHVRAALNSRLYNFLFSWLRQLQFENLRKSACSRDSKDKKGCMEQWYYIYVYITVMMGAVKIIKYIRNRVLHLRVFEAPCECMGLQHHHLIFYAAVIRFRRGRVLARLFDLRKANKFLREWKFPFKRTSIQKDVNRQTCLLSLYIQPLERL